MIINHKSWDLSSEKEILHRNEPLSLFLHKKKELLRLIREWGGDFLEKGKILKTDLMEESLRPDDVLFDLTNGARIFGMDISPKLVALAKARPENKNREIRYTVCDARQLSFKDGAFDMIISNSTLDHIPEIDQGIRESFRILKPGGIMIITIHNKLDFTFYLFHVLKKLFNVYPEWHFDKTYTPWDIRDRLKSCGFIVEDFSTTTHIPMGIWTTLYTCALFARKHRKFIKPVEVFSIFVVRILEKIEERHTALNLFMGLLIAFKVRKNDKV